MRCFVQQSACTIPALSPIFHSSWTVVKTGKGWAVPETRMPSSSSPGSRVVVASWRLSGLPTCLYSRNASDRARRSGVAKLLSCQSRPIAGGMASPSRLPVFRSLWGCLDGSVRQRFPTLPLLLQELGRLGYDGIEASLIDLGADVKERERSAAAVHDAGMGLVVGVYSSWQDYEGTRADHYDGPDKHLGRLKEQLRQAADLGPCHINCHSGSDAWPEQQCLSFFSRAIDLQPTSVPVSHETHRGRPLGHPFLAARLLTAVPPLRLTLDVSHWFLVSERLLGHGDDGGGEEEEVMRLAAERTSHVHARVGTAQAPQVGDVRDHASHGPALDAHFRVWTQVLSSASSSSTVLRFTPEYGPPPYATALGRDHWQVTNDAADQLRARLLPPPPSPPPPSRSTKA